MSLIRTIISGCCVLLILNLSVRLVRVSGHGQLTDVRVLQPGDDGQCPSTKERERVRKEVHQLTKLVMSNIARRIAFINMTDTNYSCPNGLNLTSYSHLKRTCGRSHTMSHGCPSTTFSVGGSPYRQVHGRIRSYQFGATNAFSSGRGTGIDDNYVDGVSLTLGEAGNRQHIWTFAAGLSEVADSEYQESGCPCDTVQYDYELIPSYVGNDYFCESGLNSAWIPRQFIFHPSDVLWDGLNCIASSQCCQFNNPPWFTKILPSSTTDDIELRICTTSKPLLEDTSLELIELYVQ